MPGGISSVTKGGSIASSAPGRSAAASACSSLRKPSTAGGKRSGSARYGSGAMPMPPPTSSGRSTSRRKPFPSGPKTWIASPGSSSASASRPRADRIDQECELSRRCEAERERARQQPAGRLEHEELSRRSRVELAALEPQQRVEPDRLGAVDAKQFASRHRRPRARFAPAARGLLRARAPAIACTAIAAPDSVVMHGMREASAASRIA